MRVIFSSSSGSQPVGEAGRPLDERAAQPLHVEDGRDVVGAVLHHAALHRPLPGRSLVQRGDAPHLHRADLSKPIGVSEYKVTRTLPEELGRQLPSVEDLQKRIHSESSEAGEE